MRDDIGAEDFTEIVLLFFSEIGEKLEQMGAAVAPPSAGDFHFLRGSAANLGFVAMVRACEEAEGACREGRPPDLAAVVHSYQKALESARLQVPELSAAR